MPAEMKKVTSYQLPLTSMLLVLVSGLWLLVSDSYAAPCYGTRLPLKHKFFAGLEDYIIFKRYEEHSEGKLRSLQNFVLLSYGLWDWLSQAASAGQRRD
jgi:hypothetical protein